MSRSCEKPKISWPEWDLINTALEAQLGYETLPLSSYGYKRTAEIHGKIRQALTHKLGIYVELKDCAWYKTNNPIYVRTLAQKDQEAAAVSESQKRKCRKCGCTNDKACKTEDGPCHWVEPDLCSACL